MAPDTSSGLKPPNGAGNAPSLADRLLWLCPIVGLFAGAVILWQFGFTLWTGLASVFLIACPLVFVWVLVIDQRQNSVWSKNLWSKKP